MAMRACTVLVVMAVVLAFRVGDCASSQHAAPAPAVDCSSLILNMADCLSFVQNASTETKPAGTCCTGLKTVLKADAGCLCEAFKSSAQLGVVLNITKAMSLPSACKVSAPSTANCGLSVTPAAAPGAGAGAGAGPGISLTPGSSPESAAAAAPESSAGGNGLAPASSPESSGSFMLGSFVGFLLVGLVVASFPLF